MARDLPPYRIRCTTENRKHRRFEPVYRCTETAAIDTAHSLANRYQVPVTIDRRDVNAVGREARAWQRTAVEFRPKEAPDA